MNIKAQRELLFDENFKPRENVDLKNILEFCHELTRITGIQCCTHYGGLFEHLPDVYHSIEAMDTDA